MIQCDGIKVRLEGTNLTLINDWLNITKSVYYMIAQKNGLKETSELFIEGLQVAANDAANDLREKGELPDE